MQERTLVLLSAQGRPLEWLTLASDGRPRARGIGGPPQNSGWIGLLAAPALSVRWLQAPVRGREKWRAAARYALEEHLADDLDSLHIALPERLEAGATPVAVVQRQWFAHWLEQVRAAGQQPARIIPIAALVASDQRITVEELTTLRHAGVGCTLEPELLALAGDSEALSIEDPLAHAAARLEQLPVPELLSGEFAGPRRRSTGAGAWGWVAMVLALVALVELATRALTVSRLRQEEARLEAETEQILKTALGADTPRIPGSERQQLQNELDRRSGGGTGGSGLIALLGTIAPILASEGRVRLKGLEYRDQQLELSLEGGDVRSFDLLRERFSSLPGLKTEVGDLNYGKATVTGQIRIGPG